LEKTWKFGAAKFGNFSKKWGPLGTPPHSLSFEAADQNPGYLYQAKMALSNSENRFGKSPTGSKNANFKVAENGVGAWGAPYAGSHGRDGGMARKCSGKIGTTTGIAESERS